MIFTIALVIGVLGYMALYLEEYTNLSLTKWGGIVAGIAMVYGAVVSIGCLIYAGWKYLP